MFIRFQSSVPNRRGSYPGIFAMANGLRDTRRLSDDDAAWLRRENTRGNRIYTDPSTVIDDCFSPQINPGARSWFKDVARDLLHMAHRYTELLDKYEVPWVELRTERPGRIVYEDAVQVVAAPFVHDEHWPLVTPDDGPR